MIVRRFNDFSPIRFHHPTASWPFTCRIPAVLVGCLLIAHAVDAATLTLEWDPPTDSATVGYILWYGNQPGNYTAHADVGFLFKYRLDGLADSTPYCFAVQAYDKNGSVSDLSSEVCTTTPAADDGDSATTIPPPPTTSDPTPSTDLKEIVMYASRASRKSGHWGVAATTSGAGGQLMRSTDYGWASPDTPLASPSHYFELQFEALANTPYTVWLRLRAGSNSKWNDSVWVQFSDSLVNGKSGYRIGTTSALNVNLERCNACGTSGWGWFNTAYWLAQTTKVTFAQSGTHTIRIQTREDGVEVDQVVLSSARFASAAPGPAYNDSTILTETVGRAPTTSEPPPPPPPNAGGQPFSGTPIALPGTIEAAHFDNGGAGVAYLDNSPGNAGGAFRKTDVDIQPSAGGGYNIGWTSAGEWVNYTVNVTKSGTYTLQLRVASVGGGSLQVSASAPSNLTRSITVPNTGGWQTWTTVPVPITLAAGQQTITVRFTTSNINFRSIVIK